jgi:hypothetical protein
MCGASCVEVDPRLQVKSREDKQEETTSDDPGFCWSSISCTARFPPNHAVLSTATSPLYSPYPPTRLPHRASAASLIGERVWKCDMRNHRRVERKGGSGKDNGEGTEVRRTSVEAHEAQTVTQRVDHTTADTVNPNVTSDGSTEPADGSRIPTVRVGATATRVKRHRAKVCVGRPRPYCKLQRSDG